MESLGVPPPRREASHHAPFQFYFVWTAIGLAIAGGFGVGTVLTFSFAYGGLVTDALPLIQLHGHLQLIAWTGLHIIAVSLHVLPRLTGSRGLPTINFYRIYLCIVGGLVMRIGGQLSGVSSHPPSNAWLLILLGGIFESLGILLYVKILFRSSIAYRAKLQAAAAQGLKPFFVLSLCGWLLFAVINTLTSLHLLNSRSIVLEPWLNNLAVEVYLGLVLLPICFAFSINTFPIFLRSRAPTWPVKSVAISYALSMLLLVVGEIGLLGDVMTPTVVVLGRVARGLVVLLFIYQLDLLRIHDPWFKAYREVAERPNRIPRKHAADYGQFGRFELLLYGAYFWLALGACGEIITGAAQFLEFQQPFSTSIIRHLYLLGFVSHLLLGMVIRMVSGFLGQSRVPYPLLVNMSFVFIFLATFTRVAQLAAPFISQVSLLNRLVVLSGPLAIAALSCMVINVAAMSKAAAAKFNQTGSTARPH